MTKPEYQKQWREAHRAEAREYQKRYQEENREFLAKQKREYYQANRDKLLADVKARHKNDPTPGRLRAAKWIIENPEKRKAICSRWSKANPEYTRVIWRNRHARIKGNGGTHTKEDIAALREKQQGKCAACGCAPKLLEVDHVIPLRLGGSNGPENLQLLCPKCNRSKGAKHPDEWRKAA